MLSVIFPTYNEEGNVLELHARLKKTLDTIGEPYEIIASEGPSTDNTLPLLKSLSPIKIIVFVKKMGQAAALNEGIRQAQGDIVVLLDADLQNSPEDIPKMLERLREGYDSVSGWRKNRHDPLHRKLLSRFANALTSRVVGVELHDFSSPFKVCRKEAFRNIMLYGEMHAFVPAIFHAHGFKITEVPVEHSERRSGKTKYSSLKVAKIFTDLMVVKFFSDYFARPLLFFGGWGLVSMFLGFVAGVVAIVLKFMGLWTFTQTPLPVLAALFIIVGVLLVMMGFLAEILFRIYYENKGRTPYIVKEVLENK
ncbi:glycosyltransferase [bacterium]|nr:glycosyltransferase [bacterium]|tara:strand:- start:16213 stop:17139 length:927 start_codon:yes stop_codon:yes gene_type:complete